MTRVAPVALHETAVKRRVFWKRVAAALATALLMLLAFPAAGLWPLALVCLAPLSFCVLSEPLTWGWGFIYYLSGVVFYLAGLFWLIGVSTAGYVVLCFFLGLYTLLFCAFLRRLGGGLKWPAVWAVPVAFTGAEYLRGTLFTGFPSFSLGISLAPATPLIQIADVLGVSGVTFFAALAAGWATDVALGWRGDGPRRRRAWISTGVFLAAAALVCGYGFFRLAQRPLRRGPRVGVVQTNVPESLKESSDGRQQRAMVAKLLALSARAARKHPAIIAWPETMVPGNLNSSFLNTPQYEFTSYGARMLRRARSFNQQIAAFSKKTGISMLIGASYYRLGLTRSADIGKNISILYTPRRGQVRPYYAKHHLVPFGEYVPFRTSAPWLHHLLLSLTPFGARDDYSLTPGKKWRRFTAHDRAGAYRFGTPICYEDVMPHPSRMFTRPRGGRKGVNFLITISNDGWYQSVAELEQHLQFDQLRAVEERVPIARSVNTGESGFVDSSGRIVKLVDVHGRSMFVSGECVARLWFDSRISFYSRYGDLLGPACLILAAAGSLVSFLPRFRRRREPPTGAGA